MTWQAIETAPKDGTRFLAQGSYIGCAGAFGEVAGERYYLRRKTWWGKTSHVPLYGWCHGRAENVDLWEPTKWRSAAEGKP